MVTMRRLWALWSKPPKGFIASVQRFLSGVAERRVAEVVGEREGFRQVFIEAERAGDGAGDLRHLDRMGEAGAVEIALVVDEDLGLVLEPAEGGGVDDAVAVALARGAGGGLGFVVQPPARLAGRDGVGGGAGWGHARGGRSGACSAGGAAGGGVAGGGRRGAHAGGLTPARVWLLQFGPRGAIKFGSGAYLW